MDKSQLNILEKLNSDEFSQYLQKMQLKEVLVFGSVLTEEFNEVSDVDIAILADNRVKIKDILALESYLEDMLCRSIDVVDINSENLDIFIKINILNSGRSIYSSDHSKAFNEVIDRVEWYYRENEHFFKCRRRDLIS